jgi:hypothetical protein
VNVKDVMNVLMMNKITLYSDNKHDKAFTVFCLFGDFWFLFVFTGDHWLLSFWCNLLKIKALRQ